MRVYAYGGTRYDVRLYAGEWPELPLGALQDRQGLAAGTLLLGCSVLAGGCALVVRTLQNTGERGGYPYTLLLDPGRAIWERFGWNVARLARALFEGEDPPGRDLLERPDELGDPLIEKLLAALREPPLAPEFPDAGAFALFAEAARAEGPLIASTASLGLDGLPSIAYMDDLLAGLPVCLATGRGWMVGGAPEPAVALGCALVLLDHVGSSARTVRGEAIERALERARGSAAGRVLEPLLEAPLHEWREPAPLVFDDIERLAAFSASEPCEDAHWSEMLAAPGSEVLRAAVAGAALARAQDEPGALGPGATRFLVEQALAESCPLPAATFARLDRAAAVAALTRHDAVRAGLPPGVDVPDEMRFELLRAWMLAADAPLDQALEAALGSSLAGRHGAGESLAVAAIEAALERGEPLILWRRLPRRHPAMAHVRARLREEAARAAHQRAPGWPLAYAAFAEDPGAAGLARRPDAAALVPLLGLGLIEELEGVHDDLARAMLVALADSPARALLPLDVRLRIAHKLGGPWTALATLDRLVAGQSVPASRVPDAQRRQLLAELGELLGSLFVDCDPPDLLGILVMFGDRLESARDRFITLPVRVTPATRERWLAGLGRIASQKTTEEHSRKYEREQQQSIVQQALQARRGRSLWSQIFGGARRPASAAPADELHAALVGATERQRDARQLLEERLKALRHEATGRRAAHEAFERLGRAELTALGALLFTEPSLGEQLFAALPPEARDEAVARLIAVAAEPAREYVVPRLRQLARTTRLSGLDAFEEAVFARIERSHDTVLARHAKDAWKATGQHGSLWKFLERLLEDGRRR